jgi:hypothetical protein
MNEGLSYTPGKKKSKENMNNIPKLINPPLKFSSPLKQKRTVFKVSCNDIISSETNTLSPK